MRFVILAVWFACRFAAAQETATAPPADAAPPEVRRALLPASPRQDPAPEKETPRLVVRRDGDFVVLAADERPIPIPEFVRRWHETTGRTFVLARAEGSPVFLMGAVRASAKDADFLFESILARAGYVLVPAGPAEAKLFGVEHFDQVRALKQTATVVAASEAAELFRRPAQAFTVVFPVRAPAEAYRAALSQLLTQRQAEIAVEITPAGSLVVTGLGPTVSAVAKILADAERPTNPPKTEFVPLAHAVAAEAAEVAESVFRAVEPKFQTVAPSPFGAPPEEPAVRVVADVRTNAVVVSGTAAKVAAVVELLRALDRPVAK